MVKVIIKFKNNNINSFEFRGHANSAEYGQDIVCASVSGISQTILLGLIDILDDNIKYKILSGYLFFLIPIATPSQYFSSKKSDSRCELLYIAFT